MIIADSVGKLLPPATPATGNAAIVVECVKNVLRPRLVED